MIGRERLSLDDWFRSFERDGEETERLVAGARTLLNSTTAMDLLAEMERNLIEGITSTEPGDGERLVDIHHQLVALRSFREALRMVVDAASFQEQQNAYLKSHSAAH